ncbi:MAG: ATP-binding protein [Acidobacteriota bacterium]
MYKTLKGRLLLPFIGLIVGLNLLVHHVLDVAMEGTLEQGMAGILGELGEDARTFDQAYETFANGSYDVDTFYWRLVDPTGQLILSEGRQIGAAERLGDRLIPGEKRADSISVDVQTTLHVVTRKLPDGTVIQAGLLVDKDDELLARFASHWRLGVLGLTLVAAGLAWWIAHGAMGGVREVRRTAEEILVGSLEARVPESQQVVEVRNLSATINRMLDKIDLLITDLRTVTVDVAHDFRSPLTRIRGAAEVVLRGDRTIEAYEGLAVRVIEETTHLEAMIATMLEIVRMDAGEIPLHRESLDPGALVREVIELYTESADTKRITLRTEIAETGTIRGDRTALRRVVANLIDNAVKFTPAGGDVCSGTVQEDDAVVMYVEDSGPGIPRDEIPRLFERFYRADSSREKPGHGLGLSYVKSAVDAHGGVVRVAARVGGGTRMEIRFLPEISVPLPDRKVGTSLTQGVSSNIGA